MEVSQPYVLATYQIARCERAPRCDFAEPLSLLKKLLADPFSSYYKWALVGQGSILFEFKTV